MSDAVVQKGTSLVVGIGSYTYTGFFVQSVEGPNPEATEAEVLDENAATATIIISNPRNTITWEGVCKATGEDTMNALIQGSTFTTNGVSYRITSIRIARRIGQAVALTIGAIKEQSMTYT